MVVEVPGVVEAVEAAVEEEEVEVVVWGTRCPVC